MAYIFVIWFLYLFALRENWTQKGVRKINEILLHTSIQFMNEIDEIPTVLIYICVRFVWEVQAEARWQNMFSWNW